MKLKLFVKYFDFFLMCKECKFQVFSKLVQFQKKFGYIEENEVIIIEFKNFKGI